MPRFLGHGTTNHQKRLVSAEPIFVLNRHAPPFGAWHHDTVRPLDPLGFAELQKRLPFGSRNIELFEKVPRPTFFESLPLKSAKADRTGADPLTSQERPPVRLPFDSQRESLLKIGSLGSAELLERSPSGDRTADRPGVS
ncbi:MAG: hypothetical protein HY787_06410 [Deltaproteobacteria bacterium]|nr:hypothetical protein [Deltaproteobacteria bacterium]